MAPDALRCLVLDVLWYEVGGLAAKVRYTGHQAQDSMSRYAQNINKCSNDTCSQSTDRILTKTPFAGKETST
eukprot:5130779-Amphidinium_carterae.1